MAEVTGMRNNALPYPVYGMAYYVTFPLLDADGDPVSPSSPDSEVSKNGDTFADCTNEATEIATSSGSCYLLLTAAEMTADIVTVQIKSTGAKTTVLTIYPRKLAVLSSGTCQGSNDTGDIQLASGDSAIDDIYNGCLCVAVIDSTTEARIINDYVGSTKVAEVSPAWNTAQPDSDDTYTIYQPEGRPVNSVNVTHINAVSASSVSAVNANIGTTQPHNFTGTGGSALLKTDMVDIAGAAVSASTAQLGVNVIQVGGTVQTAGDLKTLIDAVDNFVDTEIADIQSRLPAALGANGNMKSDLRDINGTTVAGTGTRIADAFVAMLNIATPVFTVASVNQTGDSYGRIGAAGVSLSAIPWNAAWDAEVQSECADALVAYDGLVPADLPSNFSSLGINASGHISRVTLVDTTTTNTDMITAAGIRSAVGLASANLDTQLTTISNAVDTEVAAILTAVDTEVAAILTAVGTTIPATLAGLLTTAMAEGYRADGATGSVRDLLYEIKSGLGEFAITGTTKQNFKLDGTTNSFAETLDSATIPTAITRSA